MQTNRTDKKFIGGVLLASSYKKWKKDSFRANCWPSDKGSKSVLNTEYKIGYIEEYRDVNFSISIGSGNQHIVSHCDGEFVYDPITLRRQWLLTLIDKSNSQGSQSFSRHLWIQTYISYTYVFLQYVHICPCYGTSSDLDCDIG